jgi:hypothetical protein
MPNDGRSLEAQIRDLEARLRDAELGPDPRFFQEHLADDVLLTEDGKPAFAKARVVDAHQPGHRPKFTKVEMTDLVVVPHGDAAVVSGRGTYEGPQGSFALSFLRVWHQRDGRWQIIAGSVSPG